MRRAVLGLLACATGVASAQGRVVAYVPSADAAATTGVLEVSSGRAVLGGASSVTAGTRPALVTLMRGGAVEVCQGSDVHLATGGSGDALLVALDRGALEVRLRMGPGDAVVTPDLRFTSADSKERPLDLALRVAPDGDTCVENRGKKAPLLAISDSFGESSYQLKAGQHVLFEHGSLREVVDRERTPCGCPTGLSLAEAAVEGKQPFPAAVSEGLEPPAPLPAETPGVTHTQVSTTISTDPSDPVEVPATAAESAPATLGPSAAPSTVPSAAEKTGVFGSVGRFFKRIFAR